MAELRRCIGSARFGIEAHEAPVEEFPRQPSQKAGLGRMCKSHWNQYTTGLARDAKSRTAVDTPPTPEAIRTRGKRGAKADVPAASSEGDAG